MPVSVTGSGTERKKKWGKEKEKLKIPPPPFPPPLALPLFWWIVLACPVPPSQGVYSFIYLFCRRL